MTKSALDSSSFDIDGARRAIDDYLDHTTQFPEDCPAILREAIRYSLLSPGKRLRPLLVLMATEACGGEKQQALPAAAAVEMIHTYSLIHDDLPAMDDDELRRGKPCCHIQFDEATAILAGDALIPLAFQTLSSGLEDDIAARCCLELAIAAGANRLVGGQADDLALENEQGSLQQLENIHRRKTGALLTVALSMGAVVARATQEQKEALETYGRRLGLAFQIVDDLLDCGGDAAKMGKLTNQDAVHGKMTYPALLGVEASQERAQRLVDEAIESIESFGQSADPLRSLAQYVVQRNQ